MALAGLTDAVPIRTGAQCGLRANRLGEIGLTMFPGVGSKSKIRSKHRIITPFYLGSLIAP
jgi:hypothetical protein